MAEMVEAGLTLGSTSAERDRMGNDMIGMESKKNIHYQRLSM